MDYVSQLALLIYDTLLTLPCELELRWRPKFWLGAFLYLMTRYPMILAWLFNIAQDSVETSLVCIKISQDSSSPAGTIL
jgi:hypothetical protein